MEPEDFVTRLCSKCKHGSNIRYEYQDIGLADCELQFVDRTVCGSGDPRSILSQLQEERISHELSYIYFNG